MWKVSRAAAPKPAAQDLIKHLGLVTTQEVIFEKQTNKTANHEICQGVQEIKTIYSHAEKARKKTNTEALQTDRHREEDTHCL